MSGTLVRNSNLALFKGKKHLPKPFGELWGGGEHYFNPNLWL